MAELVKTEHGRMRVSAATDRMDRTVAELGERILAQGGEIGEIAPESENVGPAPDMSILELA